MTETTGKQGSWSGLIGGCLVLVLIFGGIFTAFRYFQKKEAERVQGIEQNVLGPYWTAVKSGDFQKAHSLRSQQWQTEHSPEDLAEAYAGAIKEHGELLNISIHVANEYHEPGQEGDACRVESIYEFKDGVKSRVIFNLTRADSESTWHIGNSTTPVSLSLGDGPY